VATDPKQIVEYLDYQLDRVAAARYGQHARPAVRVQIEQARLRLRSFAAWQAQRTAEGWRIVFSEDSERVLTFPLEVGGQTVELRGRIDRIDFHESLRRLCVLDYKTADAGDAPAKTHRRGDEWIDLQLPLYRHLVRSASLAVKLPADVPIDLGYILLPKDATGVGLALAEWDEAFLQSADERAREILQAILDQKFWPPASPPPDFADDVAIICQDHRMGSWRLAQEQTP
jgi:ATP-dependent helicase/nuclease subunit B